MASAVGKVDGKPDCQPDEESDPGLRIEFYHHEDVSEHGQYRYRRHQRTLESLRWVQGWLLEHEDGREGRNDKSDTM